MQRIRTLQPDEMTQDQKSVVESITSGPRGEVPVLFQPWLRAPDLADRAQKLGEYVRYKTSLGPRLSELAILIVARHWTAQFEWYSHEGPAREAGLANHVIADLAADVTPVFDNDDESVLFDFVTELHRWREVSDDTYARALAAFGEAGVAELTCIVGYYTMAAMTLNVFRLPVPEGHPDPLT